MISIISIGFLSFLGIVVETALNIAFPQLTKYFSVPISQIQWLTTDGWWINGQTIFANGGYTTR
ncbi:hypothetical protein [Oenococcus oeni]|uniref:hypothetical protein n=1 Tax=Oenococcus oeni TaxID=1247 RepID=UPI00107D76E4|nr:hypothetical protein [Oenococcus oeni]AVI93399.1 hypothetical protein AX764_00280 [Oenococcus oeni]SYW02549.1 hypothetical protein OENI_390017 [Oenococcus oeni]